MLTSRLALVLFFLFGAGTTFAHEPPVKPRLIVAIIVDQMRADYLDRFRDLFCPGGFNLLLQRGAVFTNANYDHAPTNTGPGHSIFLSGILPCKSGIISNSWYSIELGRTMYCVEDSSVYGVGTDSSASAGRMSPRNFGGTTVGDQLQAQSPGSKVIGISIKDRGAILPAGKHPTGAFWFDPQSGNWISSTYYYQNLPEWAARFNERRLPESYVGTDWLKLLPERDYRRQGLDSAVAEGSIPGEATPVFPHVIADLSKEPYASDFRYANAGRFSAILPTPYGDDLTVEFSESAIVGEQLGQRGATDILAVSFSSPDYCGHIFGPDSHEIEDVIVRLDRQLAGFFAFIDSAVGLQKTVVVLTSDHGVTPFPEKFPRLRAGRLNSKDVLTDLKVRIGQEYNFNEGADNLLLTLSNDYVYLDYAAIRAHGFDAARFEKSVGEAALKEQGIGRYFTRSELEKSIAEGGSSDPLQRRIENGFSEALSGGVELLVRPHSIFQGPTGTTHGTPYDYDTHVPLLFFGPGILPRVDSSPCTPNDIAPTLAALLGIPAPPQCAGHRLAGIPDNLAQSASQH